MKTRLKPLTQLRWPGCSSLAGAAGLVGSAGWVASLAWLAGLAGGQRG